jgi:ParB family chromosome partitioning protein
VISGERRLRAAKKAGLEEVPAYIRLANDQQMLEMALVENIQRQDLNAIEVAITYQRLMDECDLTHEMLSERIGKNRSTVTNYIRLLKLPPEIQQAIRDRKLSMGHARALAGIEDISAQLHVFRKIIDEQLSVRATEKLIKSLDRSSQRATQKVAETKGFTPEVRKIQDRLTDRFQGKVDIKRNAKGKGKIVIPFENDERFNEILELLED